MMKTNATILSTVFVSAVASSQGGGIPIGVDLGVFFPSDREVRNVFGSSWTRIGLTPISFQRPESWKSSLDFSYLRQSRAGNTVTLIPITFGVTRSFGDDPSARPYIAFRVGPYFADVDSPDRGFESPSLGVDASGVGFNANASLGLSFQNSFYIEARYDFFSDFKGVSFNGFYFSAGVRLFTFRI